jgi:hypothetical protein
MVLSEIVFSYRLTPRNRSVFEADAGNFKEQQGPWRLEAQEAVLQQTQREVGVTPNRCLLAASRRRQACLNPRPNAMIPWFPGGSQNPARAQVCSELGLVWCHMEKFLRFSMVLIDVDVCTLQAKQARCSTSTTRCGQVFFLSLCKQY